MWAKVNKNEYFYFLPTESNCRQWEMFQRYAQFSEYKSSYPVSNSTNLFDANHSIELPLLAVLLGNMIFSL